MLGLFPIAGAPIAGSSDSPNTNGGAAGGTSTVAASGQVVGLGAASGTSTLVAAGRVVGGGGIIGASLLAAFQSMANIIGNSDASAAGQVVGRGAIVSTSDLIAAASILAGGSIDGESQLAAFAFYPAYTGWDPETKLFDYTGPLIEESDAAFEQAGRVIFAAQRTILGRTEIWLYWFDPILGRFAFEFICVGRNPRVLLDDPFDTTTSDVLLFYIRTSDQRLVYRQQRDRFLIEYETPLSKVKASYIDLYLQDVVKDRSGRLVVIAAWHHIDSGTWEYERLESALFPFVLPFVSWKASIVSFLSGDLSLISKSVYILGQVPGPLDGVPVGWITEDLWQSNIEFRPSSSFSTVVITATADIDEWKVLGAAFQSGTLVVVIIDKTLYDIDEWKTAVSYLSGTLIQIVIDMTLFDIDEWKADVTFVASGSSLAP